MNTFICASAAWSRALTAIGILIAIGNMVMAWDPEFVAKLRLMESEAYSGPPAAVPLVSGEREKLFAEANLIHARAQAYEKEAIAKARLLEAGASPRAIRTLEELAESAEH